MLTSKGHAIALSTLSETALRSLKESLTVTPETNSDYGVSCESYKVYGMSKNYIYIPRNFNGPYVGDYHNGASFSGEFVGKLKTETNQVDAVEAVLSGLRSKRSGILSLPTGYGKTTVALYVLTKVKRKTLIVVHKEFLLTQWVERIQQFIPSARVGRLQANVVDVNDKDIVIGMLQSLSKKDYDKSILKDFGFTIIDETHHVCTRTFSKLFTKINTKYLLGLSATLERKDGLTKVLHWFLGDVLYKVERSRQSHVYVKRINYKCDEYGSFPTNRLKKPSIPEAISTIVEQAERNEQIVDLVRDNLVENTRRILVLTDRRQHCMHLLNLCKARAELEGRTFGLYIGGMKAEQLKESEECDAIFATYSLAHEGLDIPVLDTLIMASPKSDIVQSVGRILRETVGKKNNPYIIDIVDMWGPFQYQFFKRSKYYKSAGFHVIHPRDSEEPNIEFHEEDCV